MTGVLFACSKSSLDTKASYSDADVLLSQVKNDAHFIQYMTLTDRFAQITITNAKQHPRPIEYRKEDSIFMRSNTISLKEKYDKMGYDGYDEIMQMTKDNYENHLQLKKKYPLWGNLNEREQIKFTRIANQYYQKNIKSKK
jgi:hypothetical protein